MLATLLWMQGPCRVWLAFQLVRSCYQVMLSFSLTKAPKFFFPRAGLNPAYTCAWNCPIMFRTSHSALVNFMIYICVILLDPILISLLKSPCLSLNTYWMLIVSHSDIQEAPWFIHLCMKKSLARHPSSSIHFT